MAELMVVCSADPEIMGASTTVLMVSLHRPFQIRDEWRTWALWENDLGEMVWQTRPWGGSWRR